MAAGLVLLVGVSVVLLSPTIVLAIPAVVYTSAARGLYFLDGNANDASGNNNHGSIVQGNNAADRHGNPNSARFFDGSNDYISINQLIFNGNDATVTFWSKSLPPLNTFADPVSCGHGTFGGKNRGWSFQSHSSGDLAFVWGPGNTVWTSIGTGVVIHSDSNWHHYAFTYKASTTTVKVYTDGNLVGTSTAHGIDFYSFSISLGRDTINGRYFRGYIDSVYFFTAELSATEVAQLMDFDKFPTAGECTNGTANDPLVQLSDPILVGTSIANNNFEIEIDFDNRYESIKVDFDSSTSCDHDSTVGDTNGYTTSATADPCVSRLKFSQPAQNMLSSGGCAFVRTEAGADGYVTYTKTIAVKTNQTRQIQHHLRAQTYHQIRQTEFVVIIRVPENVTASGTEVNVTSNITVLSAITNVKVNAETTGPYTVDFTLLTSSQAPYQLTFNSFTSPASLGNSVSLSPSTNPPDCSAGPQGSCSQSFALTGMDIVTTCPTKDTLDDAMTVTFDVGCVATFQGGCTPNPAQITVSFNLQSAPYCPLTDNVTLSATMKTFKDVDINDVAAWPSAQETTQFVVGATVFGLVEVSVGQNAATTSSCVLTTLRSEGLGGAVTDLVIGGSAQSGTNVVVQNGDATINFGSENYKKQTRFAVPLAHGDSVVLDPVSDASQAVKFIATITVQFTTSSIDTGSALLQDWDQQRTSRSTRMTLSSSSRGAGAAKLVSVVPAAGASDSSSSAASSPSSTTGLLAGVAGVLCVGVLAAYLVGYYRRSGDDADNDVSDGVPLAKSSSSVNLELTQA